MRLTEAFRRGELEIPVGALLARRFMRDDDDASILGLLKHRLEHLGVVRDHAYYLDALGDQILDCADLQCRIGAGRADHEGIDAELLAALLDASLHGVEPRDAADLDDDADLAGLLRQSGKRCNERKRSRERGDHELFHAYSSHIVSFGRPPDC